MTAETGERPAGAPTLTQAEVQERLAGKTAPLITKAAIEAKIAEARYTVDGTLTVCTIEMQNGYKVVGIGAAASPENFDPEIGEYYAYEDAFKKLWPLEGYLLRDQLSRQGS